MNCAPSFRYRMAKRMKWSLSPLSPLFKLMDFPHHLFLALALPWSSPHICLYFKRLKGGLEPVVACGKSDEGKHTFPQRERASFFSSLCKKYLLQKRERRRGLWQQTHLPTSLYERRRRRVPYGFCKGKNFLEALWRRTQTPSPPPSLSGIPCWWGRAPSSRDTQPFPVKGKR